MTSTKRISTLAVAIAIALAAPLAWGQGQGPGGGGGGGNKPPGGETAVNNLSYPAVKIDGTAATYIFTPSTPLLGANYSYGCNVPETVGESKYPNTSCVSSDGLIYYSAETCRALVPNCADPNIPIERIYWQKTAHKWSADATVHLTSIDGPRAAQFVDWSDSLESQIWWDTASIRVETTPFAALAETQTGLTMWHVYGQGTIEMWGARASEAGVAAEYESPVAILHTGKARLNISKLSTPLADCTTPVTWGGTWDPSTRTWSTSTFTLYNGLYTAELNIGGKYVYGYNWQLRRDIVPPDIGKTGWWRLTFYTEDNVVGFAPGAGVDPPGVDPTTLQKTFTPVADSANSLSYIDICVRGSKGGGGTKGGPKPK